MFLIVETCHFPQKHILDRTALQSKIWRQQSTSAMRFFSLSLFPLPVVAPKSATTMSAANLRCGWNEGEKEDIYFISSYVEKDRAFDDVLF